MHRGICSATSVIREVEIKQFLSDRGYFRFSDFDYREGNKPMASSFKRNEQPSWVQPCSSPCKVAKGADSQLSLAVQKRIESFTGNPEPASGLLPTDKFPGQMSADTSPSQKRAATLGPTLRRFNRYSAALPYARAASDMNNLGDDPKPPKTDEPKQPKGPCLTRLPVNSTALCQSLGLPPGTLTDGDLRNDTRITCSDVSGRIEWYIDIGATRYPAEIIGRLADQYTKW